MEESFFTVPFRRRAFTLIEIIAVLVVLAVVAAMAIAIVPRSTAALSTEADRVAAHLRHTQIRAQADTHQWRLVFTGNNTYQLGPVIAPGLGFTPDLIPGTTGPTRTLSGGVTSVSGAEVRFDSWGRPVNAAGTPLVANQTISLTEGGRTVTLTIHAGTGLIP